MSVGHLHRAIEAAGVPATSVYVRSFGHIPALMGLSRAVVTRHPMGRPLGAPGDRDRQREVIVAALELLTGSGPAIVELDWPWRPGHDSG